MELPWNFTSFFFFFSLTLTATSILVSANTEAGALYAFKQSLSDPKNILNSWDPTLVDPCTWFHVTCNQANQVIRVDLGGYDLSEHLVPELGKLGSLQYLELYENKISGVIPRELGNLKSLISLDLYKNNLSGNIPRELGNLKNLLFLHINNNRLTGKLPREVQRLPNLRVLDVSNNRLTCTKNCRE